jgi:HTH-type transcriptional repressor of NAD biosynthesis genes
MQITSKSLTAARDRLARCPRGCSDRRELAAALTLSLAFAAGNALRLGPLAFSDVEVAAFVTGAWSVWLCARNDVRTWPLGVANGAIFVWLFWDARLYADAAVNCWYVVIGLYGWWLWGNGGTRRGERPVSRIRGGELALHALGVVVLTAWAWRHLEALGDSAPFLDALTSAISLSAVLMQARRQVESWYLWIAVDLVYVPLYVWRGLPLTGALYLLFLGLCAVGLRDWRRRLHAPRRFGHGVVAGRFMPFHRGHRFLIRCALDRCDRVTVLVCEKRDQAIPGAVRADWIRRSLPGAEVVVVDQDAAGLADDDSVGWARATVDLLGSAPDVAFTSEAYGDAWSAAMGAAHVLVDLERTRVPISATRIREAPLQHLGFLEPHVARWFQPALVCVLGAESTGKTTLARDLALALDAPWVPEYGRLFTERLPDPLAHVWTEADFVAIAERQDALEEAALSATDAAVVVCDTSSLVTGVFCEEYTGRRSRRVDELAAARAYDLLVLTDPATPFRQDATGLRVDGARRTRMHARYAASAAASGTPIVHVTGSRPERLDQAVGAVTSMLERRHDRGESSWPRVASGAAEGIPM